MTDYSQPPVPGSLVLPKHWDSPIPRGYRQPLRFYTGRGYHDLNRKLRTGEPLSYKEQQVHEKLWKLMAAAPKFDEHIPAGRIARVPEQYRGKMKYRNEGLFDNVDDSALTADDPRITRLFKRAVGRTIRLPGYTSTTHNPESKGMYAGWPSDRYDFPGQILMKVLVHHGIHVHQHTRHPDEHELLLPHNSRFYVHNYFRDGPAHRLTLEQVV